MNTYDNLFKTAIVLILILRVTVSCYKEKPVPAAGNEAVSTELTHPRVTALEEDNTGHIWVGTTHGLNRALPSGYHQYLAGNDSLSLSDNHIARLFQDRSGRLWVATINGRICYLTEEGHFVQVPVEYRGNVKISFLEMPDGCFFCNNENGIYRFLPAEGRMERIIDGNTHNLGAFVSGKELLVAYPDHLAWYSPEGVPLRERVLSAPCSTAIMDPDGDLWLSVGPRRRLEILQSGSWTPLSLPAEVSARLDGKEIPDILRYDGGGNYLLLNIVEDLLVVDKQSWTLMEAQEAGLALEPQQYNLNCIHYDGMGNVWVGTDGGGTLLLPNSKKGSKFHALLAFFRDKPIQTLSYDETSGELYIVAGRDNAYRYNPEERTLVPAGTVTLEGPGVGHGVSLSLADGRILSAESNKDLILTSAEAGTATLLDVNRLKEALGSDIFIPEELFEDSRGQVWIGTQSNGVVILDPVTHDYTRVSAISCPEISSIAQVGEYVWVATQYGLNEYTLDGTLVDSYMAGNGVSSNAFTEHCVCVLPGDILLLGTMQGIVVRYPSSGGQSFEIPFYFEDLRIQNTLVRPGKDSPIQRSMVFSPAVKLSHDWNSFSISFAALDYRNAIHGSYSYMLEGFDHFWIDGQESHEAFYSNIPPGHYTFRARLSDKSGNRVFGDGAIEVTVLPAPWATWWAKLLYILLTLAFLSAILYTWRRFLNNREKFRRAEAEKQQEQHTNQINKQYFANVAHQLRTPLTMISGPIGTLSEDGEISGSRRDLLRIVRHNTDRMLHLVNQIMDFNALETDALALKVSRCDLLPTLRQALDIYQVNAAEKGISFLSDGLDGNAFIYADADKVVNILDNLLSNAFKFTPPGGFISVSFTQTPTTATVKVANSGSTIPENKLERIFERYYQIDGQSHGHYNWGSGVGLYYARKLAQLHHGSLSCANAGDGSGVCFTLSFPIEKEAYRKEELDSGVPVQTSRVDVVANPQTAEAKDPVQDSLKPSALVVDDDTDITFYLRTLLSPTYQVTCCYDVESARKELARHIPDIILSDVMMTGQTGLEFCESLKEDLQYCHIPVVLLTAKDSVRDQIEGLNVGADAYVTKPFNAEYLLSLLGNLLKGRERLKTALTESAGLDFPSDNALSPQDKTFLKELYALMDEEISNAEFNIGDIVDKLHISHSKFIYKVKGLTGVTPSELFKSYKLNKAAALLREGKYNISEVADLTGFSTLAHFSKVFKKKFGVPPSEFK